MREEFVSVVKYRNFGRVIHFYISLSGKCLSFTDACFTTTHLYTNMKSNLSNVVISVLIEQNGLNR